MVLRVRLVPDEPRAEDQARHADRLLSGHHAGRQLLVPPTPLGLRGSDALVLD